FVGLCPLHRETHPSFYVNSRKNLFYCHGCGRGGDLIRFVQLSLHLSFQRIFSMIRGSSKAERKRVEETKRQRWNIFDCFCSISLDKPPRLFYAELDEWPIRNQPG